MPEMPLRMSSRRSPSVEAGWIWLPWFIALGAIGRGAGAAGGGELGAAGTFGELFDG